LTHARRVPSERPETRLLSIEIFNAVTHKPLGEIAVGESFRVRLTYSEDPGREITETVTIRTSAGLTQQVRVTGQSKIILSDPISVAPSGQ